MNKLRRAWLNFRRKEINAEEALASSAEATDDRLPSTAGYIGGLTPAAGPISSMGNLEPNSTSPVSDVSSAVAEDFPGLDTGRTGAVHAEVERWMKSARRSTANLASRQTVRPTPGQHWTGTSPTTPAASNVGKRKTRSGGERRSGPADPPHS
ncbi:MAG TPA: hypothetical protein VG815_16510 [Chloroflexota bacterium]|nr:hypothetical protein [Chloroflexota bacterium]